MTKCDDCKVRDAKGQAKINGEIKNLCIECGWIRYDELNGNIDIVGLL